MHEFVLSGRNLRKHGIKTLDVAKRLLDFGVHAPTVYFPLIVEEALMIEPTETETLDRLEDFAEAIQDRLHEPYRAKNAPLLEKVRADLPDGALGATLSGSGPSVIVWARPDAVEACEEELARRFADASVLRFTVSAEGAGRT